MPPWVTFADGLFDLSRSKVKPAVCYLAVAAPQLSVGAIPEVIWGGGHFFCPVGGEGALSATCLRGGGMFLTSPVQGGGGGG